jgi:hypothetical protein
MSHKPTGKILSVFSAYLNGNQVGIAPNVPALINWNTIDFDTLNEFSGAPLYAFVPRHSGYYLINSVVKWSAVPTDYNLISILINGVILTRGLIATGGVTNSIANISFITHLRIGQRITIQASHGAGGPNNDIEGIAFSTRFQVYRLT